VTKPGDGVRTFMPYRILSDMFRISEVAEDFGKMRLYGFAVRTHLQREMFRGARQIGLERPLSSPCSAFERTFWKSETIRE
jgi:hypothetical protein